MVALRTANSVRRAILHISTKQHTPRKARHIQHPHQTASKNDYHIHKQTHLKLFINNKIINFARVSILIAKATIQQDERQRTK